MNRKEPVLKSRNRKSAASLAREKARPVQGKSEGESGEKLRVGRVGERDDLKKPPKGEEKGT